MSDTVLSREAIFAADDLSIQRVRVPEWGGVVCVRRLTVAQREEWENLVHDETPTKVRERLVAMAVCDEAGNLLFTPDDIEALGGKSIHAVQRVFDVVLTINAMRDDDIEDMAGNSAAAPEGGSSSGSPET